MKPEPRKPWTAPKLDVLAITKAEHGPCHHSDHHGFHRSA